MQTIQHEVWENSKRVEGQCSSCPEAGGEYNHPGFFNPEADVMVVEETPSETHFGYDSYDRSRSYDWYEQFYEEEHIEDVLSWPPVRVFLERVFGGEPLGFDRETIPELVFMTSCVKCPAGSSLEEAYASCQSYLEREIEEMDPEVIITAGSPASKWTAELLGVSDHRTRGIAISKPAWWGLSRFDTDPPLIHVPHWGYYHTHHRLTDDQWVRCIDGVRDGLVELSVFEGW